MGKLIMYVRNLSIPCERYQKPSNADTDHLTYLRKIRDQIPPPLDAPVALLIGMNHPEALAPVDYLNEPKRQSFA